MGLRRRWWGGGDGGSQGNCGWARETEERGLASQARPWQLQSPGSLPAAAPGIRKTGSISKAWLELSAVCRLLCAAQKQSSPLPHKSGYGCSCIAAHKLPSVGHNLTSWKRRNKGGKFSSQPPLVIFTPTTSHASSEPHSSSIPLLFPASISD